MDEQIRLPPQHSVPDSLTTVLVGAQSEADFNEMILGTREGCENREEENQGSRRFPEMIQRESLSSDVKRSAINTTEGSLIRLEIPISFAQDDCFPVFSQDPPEFCLRLGIERTESFAQLAEQSVECAVGVRDPGTIPEPHHCSREPGQIPKCQLRPVRARFKSIGFDPE
jgi:hypothetical protein